MHLRRVSVALRRAGGCYLTLQSISLAVDRLTLITQDGINCGSGFSEIQVMICMLARYIRPSSHTMVSTHVNVLSWQTLEKYKLGISGSFFIYMAQSWQTNNHILHEIHR